jgi:hypothetical protein
LGACWHTRPPATPGCEVVVTRQSRVCRCGSHPPLKRRMAPSAWLASSLQRARTGSRSMHPVHPPRRTTPGRPSPLTRRRMRAAITRQPAPTCRPCQPLTGRANQDASTTARSTRHRCSSSRGRLWRMIRTVQAGSGHGAAGSPGLKPGVGQHRREIQLQGVPPSAKGSLQRHTASCSCSCSCSHGSTRVCGLLPAQSKG